MGGYISQLSIFTNINLRFEQKYLDEILIEILRTYSY